MHGGSRQPLGQHFLVDSNASQRIFRELHPEPDQFWLEIGPGHGELTRKIAETGATVFAIEVDSALAARLRQKTADLANLRVVTGDILTIDLEKVVQAYGKAIHVYGSLPYYITYPILRRLFGLSERIVEATIVVQYEVAQRLVACPDSHAYGFLSLEAQWFNTTRILFRIPPQAFRPRPKVWSALVRLTPPGRRRDFQVHSENQFLKFGGLCFRQKRKTLLNNLRQRYGVERVMAALELSHLTNKIRAEQLSIDELVQLFEMLETGAAAR